MTRSVWPCLAAVLAPLPAAATAQESGGQSASEPSGEAGDPQGDEVTIIVEGKRPTWSTLGDFEPELVLMPEDIAAYGAGSLGELLRQILAETSSGRGRSSGPPVVLINGRRVSGFREVGRYPVSAVARVEVLPEEVSLAYGFAADQRVINFILKRNVNITTATVRAGAPFEGGRTLGELDGQFLKIDGAERFSLDGTFETADAIREADRDIVFSDGSAGSSDRTIAPDTREWSAGFSASLGLPAGSVATLSGSYINTRDTALFGASSNSPDPLSQITDTSDLYTGLTVASGLAPSTWTLTASYSEIKEDTATDLDTQRPSGRETNLTRRLGQANALLNQRLASLAAGPLTLSASLDLSMRQQDSAIAEAGIISAASIGRDAIGGRVSLDLPILAPAPIPGDFALNGNVEVQRLSDFGSLVTYGYGVRWRPVPKLRLLASITQEEGEPALNDLGAPIVVTPGSRVFDFATLDNALATRVTGGNPDLVPDTRRVWKAGLQWTPSNKPRISVNLDYTSSRIDREVRRFALLTPEFESAFTDRVLRDAAGALLSFDNRPVQIGQGNRDELRTAITFSKRLATKRRRQTGPAPAKRRRSGRPGSLRISAIHRLTLRDEARLTEASDTPVLDFLRGSSGDEVGGTPRHQFDFSMYRWKAGIGLAMAVRYQSATRVTNAGSDLRFSDLTNLGARVTYEFNYSDAILNALPVLEETLVAINVSNIFDQKQRVTGPSGQTPDNFQPDLLDPFGRLFRIDIRKRF
ncbi:MAG: TonB-dependent receptor [Pseudomonadota bacterium]